MSLSVDSKGGLRRSRSLAERVRKQQQVPFQQRRSLNLSRIEESSGRESLPAWDRTVDVVYHKSTAGQSRCSPEAAFRSSIQNFLNEHDREQYDDTFLPLPPHVRFLIFRQVIASHSQSTKPICLNRNFSIRDCWEETDFESLCDVLRPLKNYQKVSFGFYADVLLTILSDRTFYATFSPFVDRGLNPLATQWLNDHGRYMRKIIIEVDCSRFGLSSGPNATKLLPGLGHVEALLGAFGVSQQLRDDSAPLESLVLLCRRFYGTRSVTETDIREEIGTSSRASSRSVDSQKSERSQSTSSDESTASLETGVTSPDHLQSGDEGECLADAKIPPEEEKSSSAQRNSVAGSLEPSSTESSELRNSVASYDTQEWSYCPNTQLQICNHLLRLKGKIESLRMCGFDEIYSHQFIQSLFPEARGEPAEQHCYRVTPSTIWPRLKGQRSFIDIGLGYSILDDYDENTEDSSYPNAVPMGPIQLPAPRVNDDGSVSLPSYLLQPQRPRIITTRSSNNTLSKTSTNTTNNTNPIESGRRSNLSGRKSLEVHRLSDISQRRSLDMSRLSDLSSHARRSVESHRLSDLSYTKSLDISRLSDLSSSRSVDSAVPLGDQLSRTKSEGGRSTISRLLNRVKSQRKGPK